MSLSAPAPPIRTPFPRFFGLKPLDWLIYRSTWLGLRVVDQLVFRTRATGLEKLDNGPLLLLSNHVSVLDPFCVGLQMWRPCRFMAATSVCELPVIGRYLRALGAFPKMKFVKDRDSMRVLTDHYDNNRVVTLFPEGVRTWTGEPMPVHAGIGRLIKRLDARVMFARSTSAYFVMPRWATYPRYVPLDIEYVGPVTYDQALSAEEIAADVARQLAVEPTRDASRFAAGFRIAEGLPELVWACPVCHAQEALRVVGWRGRDVACQACSRRWRLDLDAVMNGLDGAPTMTVAQAHHAVVDHVGPQPTFQHPDARLRHFLQDAAPAIVAQGALRLDAQGLRLADVELAWSDLLSASVDVGSQIFLRVRSDQPKGQVYRLEVPGHSSLKWGAAAQRHLQRVQKPAPGASTS